MLAKQEPLECQIQCVPQLAQPIGAIDKFSNFFSRLRRFLTRRTNYIRNWVLGIIYKKAKVNMKGITSENAEMIHLQAGDLVCVKSKAAIQSTLNRWNRLKGCAFLEEMWPYCGTTHRVMKIMEKFLDERDYQIKKTRGIVLLDGVICNGTVDFGKCDRSCFFFWREEWLEKID